METFTRKFTAWLGRATVYVRALLKWLILALVIGAFCGADPDDPLAAVCSAMGVMGVCGELAEKRRLQNHTGNATFRTDLIDAVFNLTEQQLREGLRYEIYQG